MREIARTDISESLTFMPQMFYSIPIFKRLVDLIVLPMGKNIVTLLFDSEQIVTQLQKQFVRYGLSKSELKILRLYLLGKSNTEISENLFISKSTLRTHLNNIYKKIPTRLQIRMQRWHLSRRAS